MTVYTNSITLPPMQAALINATIQQAEARLRGWKIVGGEWTPPAKENGDPQIELVNVDLCEQVITLMDGDGRIFEVDIATDDLSFANLSGAGITVREARKYRAQNVFWGAYIVTKDGGITDEVSELVNESLGQEYSYSHFCRLCLRKGLSINWKKADAIRFIYELDDFEQI